MDLSAVAGYNLLFYPKHGTLGGRLLICQSSLWFRRGEATVYAERISSGFWAPICPIRSLKKVTSRTCSFYNEAKLCDLTNYYSIWTLFSSLKNTSATMPSELETAMESLIKVFHRYASREGKTGTLNRRELRELMENELSNFLKVRGDLDQHAHCIITVSRIILPNPKLSSRCPFLWHSPRRTQLPWTRSWRTWTPTVMARWTLRSLSLWLLDFPLPVSSAIRCTWRRPARSKRQRRRRRRLEETQKLFHFL